MKKLASLVFAAAICGVSPVFAGNAVEPVAEPVLEAPTLRSLGAYWIVKGDDNANASVRVDYRKGKSGDWKQGPPMFRVSKGAHNPKEQPSKVEVPDGAWLFAGSVLLLEPDSEYEIKLTLADPDGGEASKTLAARTVGEPVAPKGPQHHVVPGNGGGSGTQADPFKGLDAAQKAAKPGDTFLLHAGTYEGTFTLNKSGAEGKPIVWRGAGDGEAILDAQGSAAERPERGINASGVSHVWFENLTIRNANHAIVAHESGHLVLRRCHIHQVTFGLTATKNSKDNINGYFITDNLMEGLSTWPRSKGIEDSRGVQITGSGHVIAYNRIRAFGDAVDTMPSPRCEAIDIHNNDVSELTDDGIELDYAQRNARCFENRLTNVYQGISVQPIYGGPVYIFRNVLYNVPVETFKMHNGPSGAIMVHNTSVRIGEPILLNTSKPVDNCFFRNNLFVGTGGRYAFANESSATTGSFDYDGFAGIGEQPFKMFLKWDKKKYPTFDAVKKDAPVYKNAVVIDAAKVFASGVLPPADADQQASVVDLRLASDSAAIDAGQPLPGFNDGFAGKGPDLGAYELNAELPQYGVRPAAK